MIRSANIVGYRGLKAFSMQNLQQINLLVGKNNSGKSSVLEALYILSSSGNPSGIWSILSQRGEALPFEQNGRPIQPELEVSHLFNGHELTVGTSFSIDTFNAKNDGISCRIIQANSQEYPALIGLMQNENEIASNTTLALSFSGPRIKTDLIIPLTKRGGFRKDALQHVVNLSNNSPQNALLNAQFVTTNSLNMGELTANWASIVLTPDEDRIVTALQTLDPSIERLANIPNVFALSGRGGFLVKRKNEQNRLPIGSFGDGMWRILSLAIAACRAKDGFLFVDEIDTGLHYSVMASMWKVLSVAAKELNIQIFATTHSFDCVKGLAEISRFDDFKDGITIQRVEADRSQAVPYSAEEVRKAADWDNEIR